MGIGFTFRVANATPFDERFRGWRESLEDWSAIWPKVSAFLESRMAAQFENEGSAGEHGEWAPLTEQYEKQKAKKFPGAPILTATTRLRNSLTSSSSGDAIRFYQKRSMQFGSSLPYALFHQTGYGKSHMGRYGLLGVAVDKAFSVPKRRAKFSQGDKVPARRPIDLTQEDFRGVVDVMLRESANTARRFGFKISRTFGLGITEPGEARLVGQGMMVSGYEGLGAS